MTLTDSFTLIAHIYTLVSYLVYIFVVFKSQVTLTAKKEVFTLPPPFSYQNPMIPTSLIGLLSESDRNLHQPN